jgi:hypothetical protein
MPGRTGKRARTPRPCAKCGKSLVGTRSYMREKDGDYCETCWWAKRADLKKPVS